jgi:hypothetical protein
VGSPLHKITNSRREAENFILQNSQQKRNKVYTNSDDVGALECDLGGGRKMIFDREDRSKVDEGLWWWENGTVIMRGRGERRVLFASLVLPMTEDQRRKGCRLFHKNGNHLDHRKKNLEWKTPRQIKLTIPKGQQNNKSTGLMGITLKRKVGESGNVYTRFIVQWKGKSRSFSFREGDDVSRENALSEAKECRKQFLLGNYSILK